MKTRDLRCVHACVQTGLFRKAVLEPHSARVMSVSRSMVLTLMKTDTMTDQDGAV